MKRLWMVLLAGILLLSACTTTPQTETMVQPVHFYYRTAETDFSGADGILRAEVRDLGSKTFTDEELFRLYFEGPQSKDLISPISTDTRLISVNRSHNTLVFWLEQRNNSSSAFNHALTYACLAKTALELDEVRKVQFHFVTLSDGTVEEKTFTQKDLLLYDTGETPKSMELTLYYSDDSGRLLLTEKQQIPPVAVNELPQKALELLLSPPNSNGMVSALPPGTAVQDVSISNGVCTVDFNGDFYNNRPLTEQAEQLAILSVVNTLCELDGITSVQLLSQGELIEHYSFLNLSHPLTPDYTVVGPVRDELGEFIGVLCLPDLQELCLHRLQVRVKARSSSKEAALLTALINRASQNGLANPLSNSTASPSVITDGTQCLVMLPQNLLSADAERRQLALRSITATLCSLPWITEVAIWEDGVLLTPTPLSPKESWFYVSFDHEPSPNSQVIS